MNGHGFVSLTLSAPVLSQREGKTPLIRYLAVPVGYRMWIKERTNRKNAAVSGRAFCKAPKHQPTKVRSHTVPLALPLYALK